MTRALPNIKILNGDTFRAAKKRILVVDNLSGIWPHSLLLNKLVAQFDPITHEVVTLSCGGALEGVCTVMESRKRSNSTPKFIRELDCLDCRFAASLSNQALKVGGLTKKAHIELASLVDGDIRSKESEILGIYEGELKSIILKSHLGIEFARFAIYETLLKFKKRDLDLSEREEAHFRLALKNTIRTYLTAEKFFERDARFDAVYAFAPQYAVTRAVGAAAAKHKIRINFVDGSSNVAERTSSVAIWDWEKFGLLNPAVQMWQGDNSANISLENLDRLAAHEKQLLDGRSFSVYSEKYARQINVRERLGISQNSKIALLILSSTDEVFAARLAKLIPEDKFPGRVFENQIEWVEATVDWFSRHKEFDLVIRMHPREMPNRRSSVKSDQASTWEDLGGRLPSNVVFNHPQQKIPLKNLLDEAHVVLTGWSSAGLEAMSAGIPVITYDSTLPGYPVDLQITGNSRKDYFKNLEMLAREELPNTDWNELVKIWMSFLLNDGTIRLSGRIFEELRLNGPAWIARAFNAFDLFFPYISRPFDAVFILRKSKDQARIRRYEAEQSSTLFD